MAGNSITLILTMRFYWSIDLAGLFLVESLSCSVLLVDSFHLVDCSPQASSVHGILQARILEWLAIPFSGRSSWPWNRTSVSCIAESFFFFFFTKKLPRKPQNLFTWLHWILVAVHGIWFSDQALNPGLLHWEPWVLVTGLPRKSQRELVFVNIP